MQKIYLDNAATTKVRKEVVSEMQKYMLEEYGNPSSQHELGIKAREAIDSARTKIVREIDAKLGEIYFTSGGTESNNLAIIGLAKANPGKKTIIISSIEHPSIVEPCKELEREGYKIIKIKVDKGGIINIDDMERKLRDNKDVLLVSVMHVNNIIGSIHPIEKIGRSCKKNGVLFHTDAVQSFGKLEIDVKRMNIDLLSASGHKINGPKGTGFLYIRDGIKISPIVYGGGQEKGLRSGTENVPGIMGIAKALELQNKVNKNKIKKFRDLLINELESIGGKINGSKDNRIYNNINVSFTEIDASTLVVFLSEKGICVSAGSACESKKKREDETLKAIGLKKEEINGSIRITLNEELNRKDVDRVIKEVEEALKVKVF